MKRPSLNFVIDTAAFAAFVLVATTGVLLRYLLPPGSGRRLVIWGLDRHEWGSVHFVISLVFLGLLTAHLLLHRQWISAVLKGRAQEGQLLRIALGVVGLVLLLAAAAAPLFGPVESRTPDEQERGWRREGRGGAMEGGGRTERRHAP